MKLATWNINGARARLPNLLAWLKAANPDIALLQEIKCENDKFPRLEIEDMGYNVETHGQKGFNGVAILSKSRLEDVERGLPGANDDVQARYIEATVGTLRVASIYLPNGNPAPSEKFDYKLAWMDRLHERVAELLRREECFALCGDYNVCPNDIDVYDPPGWQSDALCRPESRQRFHRTVYLGLTDAFRALHPTEVAYTFWDYQAGAWRKNQGLRIDHVLLSPLAADRLNACEIDRDVRGHEEAGAKASDHVPIWCELADTSRTMPI
ncbi:MAG: exodeoxyribonuclease III [Alphaproteobacteria bacterium]|nr:exodeoxyribonuclease III [Alphaproteobacteria bacterium]